MTIIDKLARENPNVEALQVRMAFSLAAFAQTLAQLNSWKESRYIAQSIRAREP